jgi:uncharacterized membrane protein (UPF0127 family)
MHSKSRKSKKSKLLLPILAVIILLVFLMLMIIPSSFLNRKKSTEEDPVTSSMTVPEFRKDGSLVFIAGGGGDTVAIDIEVVDSQAEITRGLMYRPYLPESAGMLFIFPREETRSFWMKNTYISLDIIFVNAAFEIVTIQSNTQPLSTAPVPSYKPAKYVIEVNADFTSKNNIKEGDQISVKF